VNDIHYDISDMYDKGALVLNTLRHIVDNDSLWFKSLKDLQQLFQYRNVTTAQITDFFKTNLRADLDYFFKEYLYEAKVPLLEVGVIEVEKGIEVKYHWNKTGFRMPVKIMKQLGEFQFIYPTGDWKLTMLENVRPSEFQMDRRSFLYELKVN